MLEDFCCHVINNLVSIRQGRRGCAKNIVAAGGSARCPVLQAGIGAMAAVDSRTGILIQPIVLNEMTAGFAGLFVQNNHLNLILEFITLKVNRVFNSMIC